ncbi:MAG: hypothetical protein OXC62_01005, partial [Aestuariivita sp.]|nr:hypothetical protein [Aestuariivita sp.]
RDDARPPGALPEASRVARSPSDSPVSRRVDFPARPPLSRFPGRSQRRREDNVTLPEEMESLVSSQTLAVITWLLFFPLIRGAIHAHIASIKTFPSSFMVKPTLFASCAFDRTC